jgi:hypothetical protein
MTWRFSKYRSHAVVFYGIRFASRKEASRYQILTLMQKSGKISGLKCQPRFELQPKFEKRGVKYRNIEYRADFQYTKNGNIVVEDSKGFRTPEFRLKQKMFEFKYPELSLKIS